MVCSPRRAARCARIVVRHELPGRSQRIGERRRGKEHERDGNERERKRRICECLEVVLGGVRRVAAVGSVRVRMVVVAVVVAVVIVILIAVLIVIVIAIAIVDVVRVVNVLGAPVPACRMLLPGLRELAGGTGVHVVLERQMERNDEQLENETCASDDPYAPSRRSYSWPVGHRSSTARSRTSRHHGALSAAEIVFETLTKFQRAVPLLDAPPR